MPRYYFDTHDGERFTCDETGLECASLDAARDAAIRALPDLARDLLPDGSDRRALSVEVRDEGGRRVPKAILALTADWLT